MGLTGIYINGLNGIYWDFNGIYIYINGIKWDLLGFSQIYWD